MRSIVALALLAVAAVYFFVPFSNFVPLFSGVGFVANGASTAKQDAASGPRYVSRDAGAAGRLSILLSDRFRAGPFVRVTLGGYPLHAGKAVFLERRDTGEHVAIVPAYDPADVWAKTVVALPLAWYGQPIRLVAEDASPGRGGRLGVADVRDATPAEFIASHLPEGYDFDFGFDAWSAAYAVVFALLIACASSLRVPRVAFLALAALEIALCRLPTFTWPVPFNEDEAQMTAQAITFASHPIPWRDVDGTTSGPLNSLAVALPALAGQTPNLVFSRIIGACLIFITLWMLYAALRIAGPERAARTAILLPLALFCGTLEPDILQYASELLPLALTAVAISSIAAFRIARRPHSLAIAGICIGALPFAKLQMAVFSVALVSLAIACACFFAPKATRRRDVAVLAVSFAAPAAWILGIVAVSGAFADFLYPYVIFPKTYIAGNNISDGGLRFFFAEAPTAAYLGISLALFFAVAYAAARSRAIAHALAPRRDVAFGAALLALVAVYSIEAPHSPFQHYILLTIVPLTLLAGVALSAIAGRRSFVAAFAAVSILPLAAGSISHPYYGERDVFLAPTPREPDIAAVRALIQPGERVAIWGWMPQYLIDTKTIMGTRDAISQFQIEDRPFRPYYRARYLRDFETNEPRYLLETIGPRQFAYEDRSTMGIESFDPLKRALDRRYRLALATANIRLFVRR